MHSLLLHCPKIFFNQLLIRSRAFYVGKPHLLTGIKSPPFQNQLLYIIYKNQLAKIYFISISSSDKLILSNYISNVNTKDNYFLYYAFNMQCLLTHLYFFAQSVLNKRHIATDKQDFITSCVLLDL